MERREERRDANRDPISGAHGAHPVGTGLGAAARDSWQRVSDTLGLRPPIIPHERVGPDGPRA